MKTRPTFLSLSNLMIESRNVDRGFLNSVYEKAQGRGLLACFLFPECARMATGVSPQHS